jgi:hypothetical protein
MHDAENMMTEDQMASYLIRLSRNGDPHRGEWAFRSTAAQRAEAFLRTLNLWIE